MRRLALKTAGLRLKLAQWIYPEYRRLQEMALMDALTGFYNRRAYDQAFDRAQSDDSLAIALFDVDYLKKVNKVLGYEKGDELILRAADAIREASKAFNIKPRQLFRRGGDEFVVFVDPTLAGSFVELSCWLFDIEQVGDVFVMLSGGVGSNFTEAQSEMHHAKKFSRLVRGAERPEA